MCAPNYMKNLINEIKLWEKAYSEFLDEACLTHVEV